MNKRLFGYLSWRSRRRNEHRREVLDALTDDLKAQRPDHVAVTGDLTHVGLPSEYRAVGEWLTGFGTPAAITVIPGNHDSYVAEPWSETGSLWEAYLASDGSGRWAQSSFPSVRRRDAVALVGVNTAVPSAPLFATGRVGLDQRRRLGDVLQALGREGVFRIVLIHHSPVPGADRWRKRLTDAAPVMATLEAAGAELVLHGHGHRAAWREVSTSAGTLPVVSVPSASAASERHERAAAYNLYRISRAVDGWQLAVRTRRYDARSGAVIEMRPREVRLRRDHGKPLAGAVP